MNEKYKNCKFYKNGSCNNKLNEFDGLCSIESCELDLIERYSIWSIEHVLELENSELFRFFTHRIEQCGTFLDNSDDNIISCEDLKCEILEMLKELYEFALTHLENHQKHQIKEYYRNKRLEKQIKRVFNLKSGKNQCNTERKESYGGMFS